MRGLCQLWPQNNGDQAPYAESHSGLGCLRHELDATYREFEAGYQLIFVAIKANEAAASIQRWAWLTRWLALACHIAFVAAACHPLTCAFSLFFQVSRDSCWYFSAVVLEVSYVMSFMFYLNVVSLLLLVRSLLFQGGLNCIALKTKTITN